MRWPFSAPFNLCLMGCVAFRGGEAITILAMKLRNGNGVSYLAQVSGCKRFSVLPTATHADTHRHTKGSGMTLQSFQTLSPVPPPGIYTQIMPLFCMYFPWTQPCITFFSLMQVLSVFVVVVRPLTGFNCTIWYHCVGVVTTDDQREFWYF